MTNFQILVALGTAAFVILAGWLIRDTRSLNRPVRCVAYVAFCLAPLVALASWDVNTAGFAALTVICVTLIAFLVYDVQAKINQGAQAPSWWNWL